MQTPPISPISIPSSPLHIDAQPEELLEAEDDASSEFYESNFEDFSEDLPIAQRLRGRDLCNSGFHHF